jgi:hypothetical protein
MLARYAATALALAPRVRVAGCRSLSTLYSKEHEWVNVDGKTATVGITTFAAKALGDVVYVGLPDVGQKFKAGCVAASLPTFTLFHVMLASSAAALVTARRGCPWVLVVFL